MNTHMIMSCPGMGTVYYRTAAPSTYSRSGTPQSPVLRLWPNCRRLHPRGIRRSGGGRCCRLRCPPPPPPPSARKLTDCDTPPPLRATTLNNHLYTTKCVRTTIMYSWTGRSYTDYGQGGGRIRHTHTHTHTTLHFLLRARLCVVSVAQ